MYKVWQRTKAALSRFKKSEKLYVRSLQELGWSAQLLFLGSASGMLSYSVNRLVLDQTPENIKRLAESVASVEIYLEQARLIHPDLDPLVKVYRKQKLHDLRERLGKRPQVSP
jgi:hypothetical protein